MKVIYNPITNSFESSNEESCIPQIMWHITDKCFLKCKTCFAREKNTTCQDMTISQAEKYLNLLHKLGVQKIDISGGEPLLYAKLPYIVKIAREKGIYVTLTTRGIGLPDNYNWLIKNWNLFSRIIVSIDGGTDAICDEYSSFVGTLKKSLTLCNDLKYNNCNILRINTVVNKKILMDTEQNNLIDILVHISPLEWCLIQPHKLNKKEKYDEYAVNEKEYNNFCKHIVEKCNHDLIKILYRDNNTYSKYWTLQSDGSIMRLSHGQDYAYTEKLSENTIKSILKYAKNCN